MIRRRLEAALWVLTLGAGAWGVHRWRGAEPAAPLVPFPVVAPVGAPTVPGPARRLALADSAAAHDPFRLDRSAAPLRRDEDLAHEEPPPPPRPALVVSGMVGPPWAAVLEGVPGRDGGVVVRGGERLGDLHVRSVSPTAVVVSSPDTTWRLTVRRTWQ